MSVRAPSSATSSSISLSSSVQQHNLHSKWALTPAEKTKYLNVYNSLQKEADGSISGPVARDTLMKSKLDNNKLMQAWQLSDTGGKGKLAKSQFCVCMHLVYKAINGEDLPSSLPVECLESVKELEMNTSNSPALSNNSGIHNPTVPQLSPTSTITPLNGGLNLVLQNSTHGSLQPSPSLNTNSRLSSRIHNSGSISSGGSQKMVQNWVSDPWGASDSGKISNNLSTSGNLSSFADFSKLPQVSQTVPKIERTGSMLSQTSQNSFGQMPVQISNQIPSQNNTQKTVQNAFSSKQPPTIAQTPSQTSITSTIEVSPYYIPAERKQNYQTFFNQEKTVDDFIEGAAARKIFMQSGLPLEFLSQIWNLVDLEQTGRLSEPQFVLAMHLLTLKCNSNIAPPGSLNDKEILEYFSSNNQNLEGFQDPEDLSETVKEIEELKQQRLMLDNDMKSKEDRLSEIRKSTEKLQDSINEVNTALANLSTEKIVRQRQLDNKQVERSECSVNREEIMKKREEGRKAMMEKQSDHMDAKGKQNKSVNDEERLNRIVRDLANITPQVSAGEWERQRAVIKTAELKTTITQMQKAMGVIETESSQTKDNIDAYESKLTELKTNHENKDKSRMVKPEFLKNAIDAKHRRSSENLTGSVSSMNNLPGPILNQSDEVQTSNIFEDNIPENTEIAQSVVGSMVGSLAGTVSPGRMFSPTQSVVSQPPERPKLPSSMTPTNLQTSSASPAVNISFVTNFGSNFNSDPNATQNEGQNPAQNFEQTSTKNVYSDPFSNPPPSSEQNRDTAPFPQMVQSTSIFQMANDDQTVLNEMTRDMSNEVIEKPGVEWASNFDEDPFASKPTNVNLNAVKQETLNDGAWGSPDFDPFAAGPVQTVTAPSGFDSNPFGGSSNDPFTAQIPVEQPSTGFGDAFASDPFGAARNASSHEFNNSQQQQKSEDEQMRLALERSRIEQ